ncbi:MAG: protein kinase, partial [bacterium]|nr:protein kinase [bacterium]
MTGARIAHYEITGKLGEGGMGVVYRAKDPKLGRDVALKVLPAAVANNPERLARFKREAHVLASLNHPHIASIYGLEESNGVHALVLELVEGPTLADRIAEGAIPLEDALPLARQMAEALEYAHEKGVVHRDLKPANVKLTAEGNVKVLDFGLAKAAEATAATGDPSISPTLTVGATQAGVIMGTAAYMSPEQARGKPADKRADIWAFGVVFDEMLTARQLFQGETVSDTLASVLKNDPDWKALPVDTPASIRRLLRRCLERNRQERLRDIGEARIAIREQLADPTGASVLMEAPAIAPEPPRRGALPWVVAVGAGVALLVISLLHFGERPPEAPLRRFAITPPVAVESARARSGVAIAPNGKHIAYTTAGAERKLWVQDLDQSQPRAIEDTDGARLPFWSPDSAFIGFADAGELKKVSVEGGLAIRLCPLPTPLFAGGSWSPGGELIVFSSGSYQIYEVPARGGAANLLISPEEFGSSSGGPTGPLARPHFLPAEAGGRVLVYTFRAAGVRTMMVQDLDSGRREILGPGTHPFYSPSGHLVYQSQMDIYDLWALPFSLDTFEVTGEAFPIARNARGPTVAADQTLVYLDGSSSQEQLVWLDRGGQKSGVIGSVSGRSRDPALSPDGQLVAIAMTEGSNEDVWIWDITRGVRTRLSSAPGSDSSPVWSPTGAELAFSSTRAGNQDIFLRQPDGSLTLPQALQKLDTKGTIAFAGKLGIKLRYAYEFPKEGGNTIVMVADRPVDVSE